MTNDTLFRFLPKMAEFPSGSGVGAFLSDTADKPVVVFDGPREAIWTGFVPVRGDNPSGVPLGAVNVDLWWISDAASGNMAMKVSVDKRSPGNDQTDDTFGPEFTTGTLSNPGQYILSKTTVQIPGSGTDGLNFDDMFRLKVKRDTSIPGHVASSNLALFGVHGKQG